MTQNDLSVDENMHGCKLTHELEVVFLQPKMRMCVLYCSLKWIVLLNAAVLYATVRIHSLDHYDKELKPHS